MPVAFTIEVPGGTRELYDKAMVELNIPQNPIDGLLFHSAGEMDGGWRVIDVWENEAAFDAFAHNRLMPILQKIGMPQPQIAKWDLHNTVSGAARA